MPKCASNSAGFAGTGQRRYGKLVDFDSVRAEFARHRVAQAAFQVMIFDRDDGVAGLLRGRLDDILAERLDAVGVNDRDADAFGFQRLGGLQSFMQRHAGGNNGDLVARSPAQHFRTDDRERFVVARKSQGTSDATCAGKQMLLFCAISSSKLSMLPPSLGYNTALPATPRIMAMSSTHLQRAVFADAHATCEPTSLRFAWEMPTTRIWS